MSDDVKDQGIYRPLFVIVEAVEAKARHILAERAESPTLTETLHYIARVFRERFNDRSLLIERRPNYHGFRFSHRCSLCSKVHKLDDVSEITLMRLHGDKEAFVDFLLDKCEELYAQPCAMELGHA